MLLGWNITSIWRIVAGSGMGLYGKNGVVEARGSYTLVSEVVSLKETNAYIAAMGTIIDRLP